MLAGLIISPYAINRPEDLLISPSKDLFAQEKMSNISPINTNQSSKSNQLVQLFVTYDQEQTKLNQTQQVLGQFISKSISEKTGTKTIALFGDSMVDTMDTNLPYLAKSLQNIYPNVQFTLLNYGIGAQTVVKGLSRLSEEFNYKDRQYPAILASKADIFIIDSFAYNPMENIDEYENKLRQLLTQIKAVGKPVYFLATIAPLKANFGKGPGGVNWESDTAWTHATKIQAHLEKGIAVAKSLEIPIIDCYHPTLQTSGEGTSDYVNKNDGIHPSVAGHQYIASYIANMLEF